MNILILNGSPRKDGNINFMIDAFVDSVDKNKHTINSISVCQKKN